MMTILLTILLLLSQPHALYASSSSSSDHVNESYAEFIKPVRYNEDGSIVLQFETRLQNGVEYGGVSMKYVRPQKYGGWTVKGLDDHYVYSILFRRENYGAKNKVQFTLKRFRSRKTGEYVEHRLIDPPSVPSDHKLSHVYTAIMGYDNQLRILIDGEEKKTASFVSGAADFMPPFVVEKIKLNNYVNGVDIIDFEPVVAVGIEIWAMRSIVSLDDVLTLEKMAKYSYHEKSWKSKLLRVVSLIVCICLVNFIPMVVIFASFDALRYHRQNKLKL